MSRSRIKTKIMAPFIKIKIQWDLNSDELQLMGAFLEALTVNQVPPRPGFQIHVYVLIDLYWRLFDSFQTIKARKITLKPAEVLALRQVLPAIPMPDDYANVIRNDLINSLNNIKIP